MVSRTARACHGRRPPWSKVRGVHWAEGCKHSRSRDRRAAFRNCHRPWESRTRKPSARRSRDRDWRWRRAPHTWTRGSLERALFERCVRSRESPNAAFEQSSYPSLFKDCQHKDARMRRQRQLTCSCSPISSGRASRPSPRFRELETREGRFPRVRRPPPFPKVEPFPDYVDGAR